MLLRVLSSFLVLPEVAMSDVGGVDGGITTDEYGNECEKRKRQNLIHLFRLVCVAEFESRNLNKAQQANDGSLSISSKFS